MEEIKKFNHSEFGEIRTVEIDNEIWFVGRDIAEKLGYKDTDQAVRKNIDVEDKKNLDYKGFRCFYGSLWNGNDYSNKILINESGVYSLILSSKLESAKRFKKWITSEVLPSLRKYGTYSMVKKPDSYLIEDSIERAKRWIEEEQERRSLSLTVEEQKKAIAEKDDTIEKQQPFVDFAKTVIKSDDCIDMNTMSKLIFKETGIHIGRNKLFDILRKNKILMANNEPYQKFIDNGTFKIRENTYVDGNGNQKISIKTLVTGKGQIRICRFIEKKYQSGKEM